MLEQANNEKKLADGVAAFKAFCAVIFLAFFIFFLGYIWFAVSDLPFEF